ncbi:MAG: uracil-DNA glycosylase family protein [Flavobacteriaceae bacterium]|nr:uracil-DNA glycosylase family protein [Flavobacteriaceae bacterium]
MFVHKHPYPPLIQKDTRKLIVGTLPPPRFSTGELIESDVDFCYGSSYNSLWRYIDRIHSLNLRYDNSNKAIEQRKRYLIENQIGIFDIVQQCTRQKIDASDLGMKDVILRDLIGSLANYPSVEMLLFIGGKSKNGPEYFFRQQARSYGIPLKVISSKTPRQHLLYIDDRPVETVSLTSSSGAANISIGSNPEYKKLKAENPDFNPFDFRIRQYSAFL